MMKKIEEMVRYLSEAFIRVFSPDKDDYPKVGNQPYQAEPYHERKVE